MDIAIVFEVVIRIPSRLSQGVAGNIDVVPVKNLRLQRDWQEKNQAEEARNK